MVVLITGAASGIGFAFAKLFAEKGYDIVAVDKNEKEMQEKKLILEDYKVKIINIIKDLGKDNAVEEIYNELKDRNIAIDILINNAGFGTFGRFTDVEYSKQKELLDVNVKALVEMCYLFGKDMINKRKGKIVNIASIASFEAGPYMAMYYSSKAFVRSFSEAISEEFKNFGVTVTAICPGPTDTKFEKNANMIDSYMFTKLHVDTAEEVAKKSYDAIMKGKAVYVVSYPNKLMTFFTRFSSLKLNRSLAKYINVGKNNKITK